MKQKVWLTTEPNAVDKTVHVDEVDYKKGVYGKDSISESLYFIGSDNHGVCKRYLNGLESAASWATLKALIDENSTTNFYTLSGTRILTEKRLYLDDLKDTHIVGFKDNSKNGTGVKGYIVYNGTSFSAVDGETKCSSCCNTGWGDIDNHCPSVRDALNIHTRTGFRVTEVWTFPTLKLLHQWLSE